MVKKLFKGAGGPDAPNVVDDNLKSEDVVEFALAVSEGPIRGLTRGAKSFNVGDTALVNEVGSRNFDKFAIGVHPGYPEGSARPLELKLGGITSNTQVGVSMVQNVPVVRQALGALRGTTDQLEIRILVNRLVLLSEEGDSEENELDFTLEYKASESSSWLPFVGDSPYVIVKGKTSSGYSKEYRRDVPRLPDDDWQVRAVKLSPDNEQYNIAEMTFESFQSTNKTQLTYPNTAIVHGLGVANGQFGSVPEFSGIYDGLVIRVPTNYNPDLHTYDDTSPWDGSFKFAWTDNPAWVLFDLITNTRYGLAKHRRYIDANRFTFYEAARWCDTMVPVPGGDPRPRYTFNDVISDSRPGMEMLGYVAGSFNALVWDDLAGQIHLRVDKDDPAEQLFSPLNVGEEGFQYTFTDITTRANDISVSFVNPELDWVEDRRRISGITTNEENITKFGRIPLDFIAVGCTNVHEAIAKAQVRLVSSLTETTMVSFTTSRQGALLSLFSVILVADPLMGWSTGGRISSYDTEYVNFPEMIFIETIKDYVMKLQTPTGIVELTVQPEDIGHVSRLKLVNDSVIPYGLQRYALFTLEEEGGLGFAKPFRVLGLEEVDGSPYMYRVNAMEINRDKYLLSETGTPITEPQYNYQQPYLPGQPASFKAVSGDDTILVMPTGEVIARILCTWRKPFASLVTGYELQFKMTTDEAWQSIKTPQTEMYISPAVAGKTYSLRVASFDPAGNRSPWSTLDNYLVLSKTVIPKALVSLSAVGGLFQNELSWVYPDTKDIRKVQLYSSNDTALNTASILAEIAYPTSNWTHVGLDVGHTVYYWARVVDTSGNFSPFSARVFATTITDPSRLITILENSITEEQLFTDLQTRINLIDAPVTGLVSKVADLVTTYGSSADAATSAADAAASAAAAIAAEAAALGASSDAIAAEAAALGASTDAIAAAATATGASSDAIAAEASALGASEDAIAAQAAALGAADDAIAAKTAALLAQASAASSATAANTSKIAAETANTAAGTSASGASTSATNAASSATSAAGSATAANTSKIAAETANTNAGTSATAAATSATNASGYATTAQSAATAANTSKLAAEAANTAAGTSATAAQTSATNASGSATAAAGSATAANTSKLAAETANTNAGTSATGASTSATNAASSATAAAGSATAANTSKIAAETANTAAGTSATAAGTSATNAAGSATAAAGSATAANTSKIAAETANTNAGTSATGAATSATNAASSATAAAGSATAANTSKIAAETANTSAGTSATAAGTSATNAASSATAAASSATAANTSKLAAETANTAAGTSATGAATSATNASGSATAAAGSATAANTSKLAAEAANTSAGTSATAAGTSATNAATSATAAAGSATAANTSKLAADAANTAAGTSATAAATSATNAASSATAAASSATAANTSKIAAETANTAAGTSATGAATSATNAASSATAAAGSATAANTSKLAAETANTAAGTSATGAATSATNAAGSATAAAGSATAANTSKIAAETANTAAGTSATGAATSATNAASSATAAAGSASAANTSKIAAETANAAAGTSASGAATSATNASGSATAAAGSATAANTSKLAAEAANTAAGTSATAASTSAGNAATSATAAASSATAASTSATTASTQAGNAATSATAASTSATGAAGSATTASNSQTAAATSATNAATSATGAAGSATAAAGSATAAAGSASTASTQATNASNSATASNTAKVAAESARDAAAGSATAAAGSATTASTQATNAGTSATAAAGSATTATTKASEALTYKNQAATSASDAAGSASAAATDYTALTARLNNAGGSSVTVEQAITAHASTLTGLSGQYSVKVNNNGYVAGFGLSSTATNGTPTSAFIISADKFGIVTPTAAVGATPKIPFIVGTVNGVSTVGVNGALVVDGTITAKSLATNFLLVGGAVGVPRTEIDKNGVRVYDAAGTIRVRLGLW